MVTCVVVLLLCMRNGGNFFDHNGYSLRLDIVRLITVDHSISDFSLCLCVCLSVCLSVFLCRGIFEFVCLSVSVCVSLCVSIA